MAKSKKTGKVRLTEKKKGIIRENKFVYLAFFVAAFIMLCVYYAFNLIPFGDKTILRMDLYHQYGPLFAELYERLVGGRSLIYSWNSGLGGSFLGNFLNYLSSPFSLLVLVFGHQNVPEAIAAIILLKAAFSSASFAYYLKKSQGVNDASIAAFGVLYAFSGFFIAYYWNVMWLDAMVFFPLVMLGIEYIIHKRKPLLFIFSLTYVMLTSYYMAFMTSLFSILYFLLTYFSNYDFGSLYDTDNVERENLGFFKRLFRSRFLRSGISFTVSALTAALLAAVALIPVYYVLQACSATDNPFPKDYKSYFNIFDFLANHLAAIEPTIRSSGTDVLPNVYSGIAALLLVPLFLYSKTISIKEKIAHVGILAFIFFSFNINYANFVWHAFHFPNDLPYRFSFMYSFILLVMAYKTFVRLKEFEARQILSVGIALVMAVVIIQKVGSKNVDEVTVITSIAFAVLYTMLFAMHNRQRFSAVAFAFLMLFSFSAESLIASTDHYSMNQSKQNYASDLPDFQLIKKKLDEIENGVFYRMELTSLRTRMDPCWYDYNGVSTFSSMAYEKVSNLQSHLGMAGNYINSYTYNPQTPIYNAMHGLKYIVNNSESIEMNEVFYNSLFTKGKFTAHKNLYYLPLAYTVDSSVLDWEHDQSNPFEVQSDYFEKATGLETPFTKIAISDASYHNVEEMYSGFDTGDFYYNKIVKGSDGGVTFYFTPEETQSYYIYVKGSNIGRVSISSPEKSFTHNDDRDSIIDLGICNEGEEVTIDLPIEKGDSGSFSLYIYGFDTAKFAEGYDKLSRGKINITQSQDTYISGTFSAIGGDILYTSIPFDKGWSVVLNGEKLADSEIVTIGGAFLGVKVKQDGPNTVEFKYEPVGLKLGAYISGYTLIAFILYIIVSLIFRKIDSKAKASAPSHPHKSSGEDSSDSPATGFSNQIDEDALSVNKELYVWPRSFDDTLAGQPTFVNATDVLDDAKDEPDQTQTNNNNL
ncbi:MAG TPA: YfhO family protein [Clostridiales bacterium]|nr:YfhO family protein [Clostridiales bacterium]